VSHREVSVAASVAALSARQTHDSHSQGSCKPPIRGAIALCALPSCRFRAWLIGLPADILVARL
jgi:hypothetical protein